MPVTDLPIFCSYERQRFTQFGSMDVANWYGVQVESAKKTQALYPTMGRRRVTSLDENKLIFDSEPRAIFKSVDHVYIVDSTRVYAVDKFFNQQLIGNVALTGNLWFDFLPVGNIVYCLLTDEQNTYVITENAGALTMGVVTDGNRPRAPQYVVAFGNRFIVSQKGTPDYYLTTVNLAGTTATGYTVNGAALTNRASGIIGQLAALHGQLYILCDYVTDIWANIPTQITVCDRDWETVVR